MGCFLFQSTIPTISAAIAAAKRNAVHHQLPITYTMEDTAYDVTSQKRTVHLNLP